MLSGIFLVLSAGGFVAIGSYLISNALISPYSALIASRSMGLVVLGFSLNLFGSICWALGRQRLDTFYFAWILYLGTLVLAGCSISIALGKQSITYEMMLGSVFVLLGLVLISKS